MCLVGGLLRAGALADLLSRPVLVGYMAGISVIMIVGQLEKVTGVPVDGDTTLAEVASFLTGLGEAHLPTVALALPLLVGMIVGTRLRPAWPVPHGRDAGRHRRRRPVLPRRARGPAGRAPP